MIHTSMKDNLFKYTSTYIHNKEMPLSLADLGGIHYPLALQEKSIQS